MSAGDVFLETERFDRVDLHGRLTVCTLDALNPAFPGDKSTDWTYLVTRLKEMGLAAGDTIRAVDHLSWFGRLVGNTDMHLGNLSFHVSSSILRLAPTYDMLPMGYAPLAGGEVRPYDFVPLLPLPEQRDVWKVACQGALEFWQKASNDIRISSPFRTLCAANIRRLSEIAPRV